MTDASYSHKFMTALAESLGWNPEAVQKALAEIAQLQNQTQELELSVQGKAPTNHASQQPIFGTADALMYGHVKIAHEVTNDSTDGVAISPDAVYAYAPNRDTTPAGFLTTVSGLAYDANGEVITAYFSAQCAGNAINIGWYISNITTLHHIEFVLPVKYKSFNSSNMRIFDGRKVEVHYTPSNNMLRLDLTTDGFTRLGTMLILMMPDNA